MSYANQQHFFVLMSPYSIDRILCQVFCIAVSSMFTLDAGLQKISFRVLFLKIISMLQLY